MKKIFLFALCSMFLAFSGHAAKTSSVLERVSKNPVTIPACDGLETFASYDYRMQTQSGRSYGFRGTNLDEWRDENSKHEIRSTEQTFADVFKISAPCTLPQIFGSFQKDLNQLAFTQHQIMWLYTSHHELWEEKKLLGYYFLFKAGDRFFVATLIDHKGEPDLLIRDYDWDYQFSPIRDARRLVVIPC